MLKAIAGKVEVIKKEEDKKYYLNFSFGVFKPTGPEVLTQTFMLNSPTVHRNLSYWVGRLTGVVTPNVDKQIDYKVMFEGMSEADAKKEKVTAHREQIKSLIADLKKFAKNKREFGIEITVWNDPENPGNRRPNYTVYPEFQKTEDVTVEDIETVE